MTTVVLMAFLTIAAFVVTGASGTNDRPGVAALSFAGGVFFLLLFGLQAASLSRGEIPRAAQSLVECGLREGVVYKTESIISHTDYRNLVVVRDESDFSHRACMVHEYLPQRFVVADGNAVTVEEDNLFGDTEQEERERQHEIEESQRLMAPRDNEIVVRGQRPQE
jgi:hypothetical protein